MLGPVGRRDSAERTIATGAERSLLFGPYLPLPAGYYEAKVLVEFAAPAKEYNILLEAASMASKFSNKQSVPTTARTQV